jgi:hypothetical protein
VDKGAAVVNIQRIYRGWCTRRELKVHLTCRASEHATVYDAPYLDAWGNYSLL